MDKERDRRLFERLKFRTVVKYQSPGQEFKGQGFCDDIGIGGMGLVTKEKLESGYNLKLWIDFPDGKMPLHTEGAIKWSEELEPYHYRCGIAFREANLINLWRVFR